MTAVSNRSVSAPQPGRMLLGTCVGIDSTRAVPDLEVVFLPDSTVTTTDSEGDFLLEWSGRAGFVQIEDPGRGACKRVTVPAAETDGSVDLGRIVAPRGRISHAVPLVAGSTPPDTLRARDHQGPAVRHWFLMRAAFDRWGEMIEAAPQSGDPAPEELIGAAQEWMRKAPWKIRKESRCQDPAFEAIIPMAYRWDPSARAWIRDPDNRPR
jgi:hypothetical protein